MRVKFHLAFPSHDLSLSKAFYHEGLGFALGRESKHAMIINCANNQLVAHKVESPVDEQQGIYPRHFGLIFDVLDDYKRLIRRLEQHNIAFHIEPKVRFQDSRLEHHSFFIKDPSNNLLEFKYYRYNSAIFSETQESRIGEAADPGSE